MPIAMLDIRISGFHAIKLELIQSSHTISSVLQMKKRSPAGSELKYSPVVPAAQLCC